MAGSHARVGASLAALALVAACGRVDFDPEGVFVFVDAEQADFDAGTYAAGTAALGYSSGEVRFASPPPFDPGAIGVFVSRPFETGTDTARWSTLAWVPTAPHRRPLPDAEGADAGYARDGADMAGNILLLHADGTGTPADGTPLDDGSGHHHDGRIVLAGQQATHVPGVFRDGLDLDRDAWITLDGAYFDYGTGDFTYAIWVRMYSCADSNDNRIALGGGGGGDSPHMWLGALCPDPCPGGDNAYMNFLDDSRAGPSLSTCTGVVLDDGAWHLLAGVKQGHTAPPATVRLYVDGREVDATTYDYGANTLTYDGGEIRIGSFNLGDPQYHTRIRIDEAAIWKRALDGDELAALYRRGVASLELQIRVCADRVCDDETFVGPDGTAATVFTEAALVGPAGSQRDNVAGLGLVGAVAQYRARFSTTSPLVSPGLVRVTVEARRE